MAVDVQGVDINGQKRELLTSILGALICSPGIDYTGAFHYLAADTIGRLVPIGATTAVSTTAVGSWVAIPAPTTGATYVFGWSVVGASTAATQVQLTMNSVVQDYCAFPAVTTANNNLITVGKEFPGGIRTTYAVTTSIAAGGPVSNPLGTVIRYAIGP